MLTLFAIASLFAAVLVTVKAIELIQNVYADAAKIAVSQHDSGVKYSTAMTQVAEVLAKHVDDRVSTRVKGINAILRPAGQASIPEEVEEAPPPPISMSGIMNDFHETMREQERFRRDEGPGYSIRDEGIGFGEEL